MLQFVEQLNFIIVLLLTLAYFYQLIYVVIGLVHKKRHCEPEAKCLHRYAVLISARNEQEVIGELIQSLRQQNYPQALLDIFVVADNCTDHTAAAARLAGATSVYERFNTEQVGKGYALDYLLRRIALERGSDRYDAYFVFDADNIVDPNFVAEMNRTFDKGECDAITCYRNSKNFGDNWISAGYSLWFLREARFLNFPRYLRGTNCAISGTGFLVSNRVIKENHGWPFHLLTEDIQFSVECAVNNRRIGYCDKAVVYDEQPVTMRQSWNQRLRWSKGFYQVDWKYTLPLLRNIFCGKQSKHRFSCYDLLMTVAPGMLLTIITLLLNLVIGAVCLTAPAWIARGVMQEVSGFLLSSVVNFYLGMLFFGALTVITEWGKIPAKTSQKLGYLFTFPIFMLTYIPISLVALVRKVEWKPIRHTAVSQRSRKAA